MPAKHISELEHNVMDIVWNLKECTVRDVLDSLQQKKRVAYTTILTIFQRLDNKGLVTKHKKKKAYIYKPRISKEMYSRSLAQGFLKKFIQSFGEVGIISFADSIDTLSKKEKDYLLQLLHDHDIKQ